MSLSILFMIGLVAFLLSCLGLFIYTLNRTARRAGPAPMRDEFGADILPAPQTSDH